MNGPPPCAHADCPDYQKVSTQRVAAHYRYGKRERQLYRCRTCGRSFSESKGTPFFRIQLPPATIYEALKLMAAGESLRAAARQLGIDKNTAVRIRRLGERFPRWFQFMMAEEAGYPPEVAGDVFRFLRVRRQTAQRRAWARGETIESF